MYRQANPPVSVGLLTSKFTCDRRSLTTEAASVKAISETALRYFHHHHRTNSQVKIGLLGPEKTTGEAYRASDTLANIATYVCKCTDILQVLVVFP